MYFVSLAIYGLLRQVHSNELRYGNDIFNGVPCAVTDETLVVDTLLGMSLRNCKQACIEITPCLSMNYIRPFHVCQLLNVGDRAQNHLVITGSCTSYNGG